MADTPYDPNSDQRYDPSRIKKSEEGASEGTSTSLDTGASLDDRESAASAGQAKATTTPSSSGSASSKSDETDDDNLNYSGSGKSKKKGIRGTIAGMSRSRKAILIGIGGGGGGVVALIILLFILASSLKIPNLMQNITTYEFARVTRQYSESANRLTTEKLAADAMEERSWTTLVKDKYQNLRDNTWGKFDKYNPQQVMKNLSSDNNFQMTYKRTGLTGRPQLVGVTLNDETHLAIQNTAKTRFVPGLSSVIDFKNNVSLSEKLGPALDAALRTSDIGPIVRGSVAKSIRQELGISLVAWKLGNFKGKDAKQARLEEARQKAAIIDEKTPTNDAVLSTDKQAVDDAKQAEDDTLKDPKKLQAAIDNGGVSTGVKAAISSAIAKTPLQNIVSVVNPIYGVAVPVCIVYDGSLDHSGSTIDNQTRQQVAAYNYGASAADQQKAGSQSTDPAEATELASAAGATSDDFGDTSDSVPTKRYNGEAVDTSQNLSAEASAGGEFTLLNATPGIPSGFASVANSIADEVCPKATNIYAGIGLGIVNIGIGIFTGGSSEIGEGAAETAATQVLDDASANLASRILTSSITKLGKARDLLFDTAKSGAKIAAATVVAKLIVNSRAGSINGGLTQGKDLAEEADSGGNIYAGMISQQELDGRPLTQSEVAQSDAADQKTIAQANSSKSMYERYLATDNAQSLLSRMAIDVSGNMNNSIFRSLTSMASMLFHPMTYVGSFATSFSGSARAASPDQHYGNVQIGWSEDEEKLIDSREDYRAHLENQAVLDDTNQEDAIASHYGDCFTKSIGDLLSSGEIVRDSNGNVIADQGLCSPNNLGSTNSDPDSPCGSGGCGDLVFRYRLAQSYDKSLDQLTDDQTITADPDPAPTAAPAATPATTAPTIVIDPGHSGQTISDIDPQTGLKDYDYANHPEITDVFDVALLVQKKLTADGYNVLMTKKAASDSVSFRGRANIANNSHAALAISIHDQAGIGKSGIQFTEGNNIVYYQAVGDYRSTSSGKKVQITDSSLAATSLADGKILQAARQAAQGTTIDLQSNTGYDLGKRGLAPGNIWMVQLFSNVPWLYNEAGGNSKGQVGLNDADKQTYANGLIAGVEKVLPISK